MTHHQCLVPECLRVASVGGAESIILSADGISKQRWEYDALSVCCWEHDTLSTAHWEYDTLSTVWKWYYANMLTVAWQGAMKKTTIGDTDDRQLTTLVNSASMAAPIGLPLKGAKFCHTSNRLLVGRQRRCALLWLYFNSSAVGRSVSCLLVGRLVGP